MSIQTWVYSTCSVCIVIYFSAGPWRVSVGAWSGRQLYSPARKSVRCCVVRSLRRAALVCDGHGGHHGIFLVAICSIEIPSSRSKSWEGMSGQKQYVLAKSGE